MQEREIEQVGYIVVATDRGSAVVSMSTCSARSLKRWATGMVGKEVELGLIGRAAPFSARWAAIFAR